MKTINCAECNVEYKYEPNPNYPDKRKYCANCSELKKATWEAKGEPMTEVIDMNTTVTSASVDKPKKEFHLSPEQVRTNALELAISFHEIKKLDTIRDIMNLAKEVEEYLWNGK